MQASNSTRKTRNLKTRPEPIIHALMLQDDSHSNLKIVSTEKQVPKDHNSVQLTPNTVPSDQRQSVSCPLLDGLPRPVRRVNERLMHLGELPGSNRLPVVHLIPWKNGVGRNGRSNAHPAR